MSSIPSLLVRFSKLCLGLLLVKISATCFCCRLLLNKVTIHLYMLCSVMVNRVVRDTYSCLVVAVQLHRCFCLTFSSPKSNFYPQQFVNTLCYSPEFCFCVASCHNQLLLTPPCYQIIPHKNTIT